MEEKVALNFAEFEGVFCDLTDPGYYAIEKDEIDIIRIPRLEVIDKVLHCEFEILEPEYSNDDVANLVFIVLLKGFCKNYYSDKANYVMFHNINTSEEWRLANIF
jgi:hypothetical protein